MNKRIDIFSIFASEGKLEKLLAYPAMQRYNDPFEKDLEDVYLNPITIKAIITQVGFSALRWKFWGTLPAGSIQIICEPKWENLLLTAAKLEYSGNQYKIYRDDSKGFTLLKREDYLVVVLSRTQNAD